MADMELDDDRLVAAVMLVGHAGATNLEFGYLHDNVPIAEAAWWATATYKGTKLSVENHVGPLEAVEALVTRLLTGARCQWCQGVVALAKEGAVAYPGGLMLDGSTMPENVEQIEALGQCQWRRNGRRWEPGCIHGDSSSPGAPKNRTERRELSRKYEASRKKST